MFVTSLYVRLIGTNLACTSIGKPVTPVKQFLTETSDKMSEVFFADTLSDCPDFSHCLCAFFDACE